MNAVQLLAHGAPGTLELREVPDPVPGAGELLVQFRACGLNHLDLWSEEGALPIPLQLPRTLGCEIAGVVAAIDPNVRGWNTGDRVAVRSNLFCGECAYFLR